MRDLLHGEVTRWRAALRRTVVQAIEAGHLRRGSDAEQLVAEIYALILGMIHDTRFMRDPRAADRSQASWQRLRLRLSYLPMCEESKSDDYDSSLRRRVCWHPPGCRMH